MGSKERRERESRERISSILDAAEAVLEKKGILAATMQQIAEKAEFTKPTLYIYFQNKDDLLHGVICRGLDMLADRLAEATAREATGFERLRAARRAFLRVFAERPHYFSIMHHEDDESLDPANDPTAYFIRSDEKTRDIFAQLQTIVEDGGKDGSLRSDLDPEMTSVAFWVHCAGIVQILHIKGEMIENLLNLGSAELLECAQSLFDESISKREAEE